ncbi:unnamed protein product [Closterium sp. Yama58-4]|nr:unnamed protein product [Closterium sp. Yama58-4]
MRAFRLPRLWLLLTVFAVASIGLVAVRLHPSKPKQRCDKVGIRVAGVVIRAVTSSRRDRQTTPVVPRVAYLLVRQATAFRPTARQSISRHVLCRTLKEVLDGALTAAGGDPSAAVALAAALEEEYGGPSGLPDPDRPFPEAPQLLTARAEDDGGDGKSAAGNHVVEAWAASSLSRTVIVTALSEAWAPMMRFFLHRLRLVEQQACAEGAAAREAGLNQLVDRLVVVAYDDASFEPLHRSSSFPSSPLLSLLRASKPLNSLPLPTPWPILLLRARRCGGRCTWCWGMLALGYDVVFTDNDILWLRNPLPSLLLAAPEDMHMSVDWLPKHRIQQIFDWIRPEANPFTRTATPLTVRYLPTVHVGGFCEMGALAELVTVHATCCFGLDSKLRVLRKIAADWDWMRALPHGTGERLEEHGFTWQRRTCDKD